MRRNGDTCAYLQILNVLEFGLSLRGVLRSMQGHACMISFLEMHCFGLSSREVFKWSMRGKPL